MIAYVGEDKIISKVKRTDAAFHAQRAMQELSFDTFKSEKAIEIVLPASLQMILPQDYVNYTRILWSDSSGIKHPIYPTKHSQNPFSVLQDENGNYLFPTDAPLGINMNFNDPFVSPWYKTAPHEHSYGSNSSGWTYYSDSITTPAGGADGGNVLTFETTPDKSWAHDKSKMQTVWQAIDTSGLSEEAILELFAAGTTQGPDTGLFITGGTLRIGLSQFPPDAVNDSLYPGSSSFSPNLNINYLPTISGATPYLEWAPGETNITKSLTDQDAIYIGDLDVVYLIITSYCDYTTSSPGSGTIITDLEFFNAVGINTVDDIIIHGTGRSLSSAYTNNNSTTWNNYSTTTPLENNIDDYNDDTYWPFNGQRYGLDPENSQVNGSFFIDQRLGKIHFSSNLAGRTIVLDYISDSLGTDEEMRVHKFAEEAMYKWMAHAIMSTRANVPEYQVNRLKKEKFAAIRQAKLRLSSIKLEEITQVFRGKSKQIKH